MKKFFLMLTASLLGILGGALLTTNTATIAHANSTETSFTDNQTGIGLTIPGAGQLGAKDNLKNGNPRLIETIKDAINRILGILGTITLVILLWGGFQMVTAAGDEGKHKKGFTILRQSAIGLIFIGVAALFVQLVFWFISTITTK